jgi:hypothetical protein
MPRCFNTFVCYAFSLVLNPSKFVPVITRTHKHVVLKYFFFLRQQTCLKVDFRQQISLTKLNANLEELNFVLCSKKIVKMKPVLFLVMFLAFVEAFPQNIIPTTSLMPDLGSTSGALISTSTLSTADVSFAAVNNTTTVTPGPISTALSPSITLTTVENTTTLAAKITDAEPENLTKSTLRTNSTSLTTAAFLATVENETELTTGPTEVTPAFEDNSSALTPHQTSMTTLPEETIGCADLAVCTEVVNEADVSNVQDPANLTIEVSSYDVLYEDESYDLEDYIEQLFQRSNSTLGGKPKKFNLKIF